MGRALSRKLPRLAPMILDLVLGVLQGDGRPQTADSVVNLQSVPRKKASPGRPEDARELSCASERRGGLLGVVARVASLDFAFSRNR